MDKVIKLEHKNGYSGTLIPGKGMTIYKDGEEVLHTFSPAPKTAYELYKCLESMEEFMVAIGVHDEGEGQEDE